MSQRGIAASWRQVRSLFEQGSAGRISDAELVSRLSNDEARGEAITALVERHGPMVLGVCRRSLMDSHDVADAFQSTFLILLQKPGSVNVSGSLGPWLHGVARRVAGRLRTQRTQRGQRDGGDANEVAVPHDSADALEKREAVEALEAEIERLPEAFRNVIVLCELSGLSHDLAAQQLGCPVGTVESRLSRGRARLRQALTRRGFAPSLALLPRPDSALIPQALAARTALMSQAEVQTLLPIIQGVIADMTRHQLRTSVLKVASAALLCGLGFVAIRQLQALDTLIEAIEAPTSQPNPEASKFQAPARTQPDDMLKFRTEVLRILTTARDEIAANYHQIETLQGSFKLVEQTRVEHNGRDAQMEGRGRIEFALDVRSNSLYSQVEYTERPTYVELATGKNLSSSAHDTARWISVVTPEHWLSLDAIAKVGHVKGYPKVDGPGGSEGRLAFRDDAQLVSRDNRVGHTFDPRSLFGPSELISFDKLLDTYIKPLSNQEQKPDLIDFVQLEWASVENGKLYRFTQQFPDSAVPEERSKVVLTFDSTQGYNVVRYTTYATMSRIVENRHWSYKYLPEGIYYPEHYFYVNYTPAGKLQAFRRSLGLPNVKINQPISADTFKIDKLGLQYGERLQDNIKRRMFVFDEGSFTPAESFKFTKEKNK